MSIGCRFSICVVGGVVSLPSAMIAATIRVPVDQPTIQAGLNAATTGDSVLVSPGIYSGAQNKNLSFAGKDVVLLSASGRDSTIIDCELDGRAISFESGESGSAVFQGFTIKFGLASSDGGAIRIVNSSPTISSCLFFQSFVESYFDSGGALYCLNSSSTIRDCIFDQNFVYSGGGGAIYAENSNLDFANDLVTRNTSDPGSGGGIYLKNTVADFTSCGITFNYAEGDGGGIFAVNSSMSMYACPIASNQSHVGTGGGVITSSPFNAHLCYFYNNSAPLGGGLVSTVSTTISDSYFGTNSGGGDDFGGSSGGAALSGIVDLRRTTFDNNFANNNNYEGSGGALTVGPGSPQQIVDCRFFRNMAWRGAAISIQGGSTQLTGNVIGSNAIYFNESLRPSIFYVGPGSNVTFGQSTCASNYLPAAYQSAAIEVAAGGDLQLLASVVFGNAVLGASNELQVAAGGILEGSCVVVDPGLTVGPGGISWLNPPISADPLFCDPLTEDFHVADVSPCLPTNNPCGVPIGAFPAGCSLPNGFKLTFESIFSSPGSSTGCAFVDLDSDGDLDLHVLRDQFEPDRLYRNDGATGFAAVTSSFLQDPGRGEGMDWGDFDNDGKLDVYVVNSTTANKLYRNLSGGSFADVTTPPLDHGAFDQGASWIDYDRDGRLDLYLTTHASPNKLYRNLGNGSFVEATPSALAIPLNCGASAWGDYDSDGDSDAFVCVQNGADVLARNDGNGAFANVTAPPLDDLGLAQGAAWGDFDNDGDLDLYVCNFGSPNRLYRNDAGSFTDIATGDLAASGPSQSGTWADYDNDRDLDLVLTNFGQPNDLFRNDGAASFERLSLGASDDSTNSIGASWGDFDTDGDLDLFIARFGSTDLLYRNDVDAANNWLEVTLEGTASNRSAHGARITTIDLPSGALQILEHGSNHGFWSCNQPAEHFGLGTLDRVDVLTIRWTSGAIEFFYDVPANQRLHIIEGGGIVGAPAVASPASRAFSRPNPFRRGTEIVWSPPQRGKAELTIFDVGGRLVRELKGEVPGAIPWDGRDGAGRSVPNGIYFYRIESGSESQAGKVVRLR